MSQRIGQPDFNDERLEGIKAMGRTRGFREYGEPEDLEEILRESRGWGRAETLEHKKSLRRLRSRRRMRDAGVLGRIWESGRSAGVWIFEELREFGRMRVELSVAGLAGVVGVTFLLGGFLFWDLFGSGRLP